MTEAGWTREKPTKNGWYWWRFDASTSATIVRIMVCGDGSLAEMSNNGHLLLAANFGGEWLGPLSPDSFQQGRVAALTLAQERFADRFKGLAVSHPWIPFSPYILELERLKQDAAQPAQDEKGVGE